MLNKVTQVSTIGICIGVWATLIWLVFQGV
jgi:hypothetical protein